MNEQEWVRHVYRENSRQHVVYWMTGKSVCSVPNCEVNRTDTPKPAPAPEHTKTWRCSCGRVACDKAWESAPEEGAKPAEEPIERAPKTPCYATSGWACCPLEKGHAGTHYFGILPVPPTPPTPEKVCDGSDAGLGCDCGDVNAHEPKKVLPLGHEVRLPNCDEHFPSCHPEHAPSQEHRCGLTGYNPMLGDTCPACVKLREPSPEKSSGEGECEQINPCGMCVRCLRIMHADELRKRVAAEASRDQARAEAEKTKGVARDFDARLTVANQRWRETMEHASEADRRLRECEEKLAKGCKYEVHDDIWQRGYDAAKKEFWEKLEKSEANQRKPCTCGSGGHPRHCEEHPGRYAKHVEEINLYGELDELKLKLAAAEQQLRAQADIRSGHPNMCCGACAAAIETAESKLENLVERLKIILSLGK